MLHHDTGAIGMRCGRLGVVHAAHGMHFTSWMGTSGLSLRSYYRVCSTPSWEEIWEAGPYYLRFSELLEDAKQYAIVAGWQIDSRLPMPMPVRPNVALPLRMRETLREKIYRICESRPDFHFYFLMWDHSYLYVPERELWQGRIWETLHPHVHFVFDNRHPVGGAHHEKICIIDGKTALCGGIDLCGDRWDGPEHLYSDPRRSLGWKHERHGPYHDLATQVGGSVCSALQRHLGQRWRGLSSVPFPEAPRSPLREGEGHAVYLSRTRGDVEVTGPAKHLVREVEFLFRDLIGTAEKRIVLEGQYFWSRGIADLLIARMREMRGRGLEIFIILAELSKARSFTRRMATYEMTLLERIQAAAKQTDTRLVMGAPYSHPPPETRSLPPRPIYIHSKLIIIDDRYLSIGSANFASRAMRIDTELNLTLEARTPAEHRHIQRVAGRVLRHWGVERSSPSSANEREQRLHHFEPRRTLRRQPSRWPWRTWVPYQIFFDPLQPWGYSLKRKIHALAKNHPRRMTLALVCASALPLGLALSYWQVALPWAWLYALLLSSSWLLPVPFAATALLSCTQLGATLGARLVVGALWSASLCGYGWARLFPVLSLRLSQTNPSLHMRERLGRRSFESFVSILADPRIAFRTKSAYPGLQCIPLPWFVVGSLLVLPAACSLACRAAVLLLPAPMLHWLQQNPALAIGLVLAWGCLRGEVRRHAS